MIDPIAMPPPLQPYDTTRGLISCFTVEGLASDDETSAATAVALRDILLDLYEEAFRRLPVEVEDVPDGVDMTQLVDRDGLCLGLLDPVTNIVLNTVSLLPDGYDVNPTRPTAAVVDPVSFRFKAPPSQRRDQTNRDSWRDVASRSGRCLISFMRAYFGLLTKEQAARYLVWARADLSVAVLLVEHDLYAARPSPPDPLSGRTRNALRRAATHVDHPWSYHLVSLATAWLPRDRLQMLAPVLRRQGGSNRLTVHDVKTILHVLRHQDDISATTTLGDGTAGDHIASLRRPQDMDAAPWGPAGTTKWQPQDSTCSSAESSDADSCPYVQSLQMSLCGAIHSFYLRALAMMPSHSGRNHVRSILLAGHCYGPMDPVSNIVLSALWYDANFPLQDADRHSQAHDILDTLTMLRAVYRSLRGLVALLHATSGQRLPLHEILKYLCYTRCDIAAVLQPHLNRQRPDKSSPNPLMAAAAAAAQHPQAASITSFYASLAPTKLDKLRSLMMSATANDTPLSHESLTQINSILKEETETSSTVVTPWQRPPKLCKTALSILTRKRESYSQQQKIIRWKIKQLLQDYAVCHPSEPIYELDFVCGVARPGHTLDQHYHVNFMATTKSTCKNSLFFAEFRVEYDDQLPKAPSICCPLPQPYDMGRCYYGKMSARHIAYPDHCMDNFSTDITGGGLDDIHDVLEADFTYFDSERDVRLARVLQKQAKQEEVMQRSFTGRRAEWNMRVC